MKTLKSVCVAGLALLGAVSFTATADARKGHGGHGGHHGGHHGHNHGHHGHGHGGWGGPRIGFGFGGGYYGPPAYSYYDDDSEDCYRVYRRGRTRIVCD
jgi:hypothetical protein